MTRRTKPRGQAMVEFALVFPIFILLLVGLFDFGRVVWVNDTLATAAREAVRYAIVHGGSASTLCPAGPPGPNSLEPDASCPPFPDGAAYPSGSLQAIKDVAQRWASGSGDSVTVSVCYGAVTSCADDVSEVGATNDRGTQVTVTVTSTVSLAAPSLLGFGGFDLSATSTMLVNH
ncbi:MAG TPA: TadE family protein [Candidatus Limnocylindria bacterium]|nr:TadE family protein [Candidatus Limnocylindria bacterium]